ncbi:MAG: S-methyl-5'-thioadenosine phosphorylase [Tissierellales bacterium]|nr:S-methyl-5'-thioadenosine phosphorylase [Tissierellales bacterium]MBN2828184.1 S-methyl-5'-thioadenosine phosphorylase [Tissierellales bacterium]
MIMKADIGIFGGSGFYSFLENVVEVEMDTPYGKPSDAIAIADYKGKKIAFLPRHGKTHSIPPHLIPYQANLYAMKELGVKAIISPCSCGSLRGDVKPGDFVVSDQFIDRTHGRKDTYFEGPEVKHVSPADPYNEELRHIAIHACRELEIPVHEKGTIVVINGPRFSSRAESRAYALMGGDTVNMTQYPEAYLALELEIPIVNVALVTDFDAGLEGREDIKPVTMEEVYKVFNDNLSKVKDLIFRMIEMM